MQGQYCLVRTCSAGVHLGELVSHQDKAVVLKNARRLWKWSGAFTLSEVATKGPSKTNTRISCAVPEIALTEAIEIIPMSAAAKEVCDAISE